MNARKPHNKRVLQRSHDANAFVNGGMQGKGPSEKRTGWSISSEQKCEPSQVSTMSLCGDSGAYWECGKDTWELITLMQTIRRPEVTRNKNAEELL